MVENPHEIANPGPLLPLSVLRNHVDQLGGEILPLLIINLYNLVFVLGELGVSYFPLFSEWYICGKRLAKKTMITPSLVDPGMLVLSHGKALTLVVMRNIAAKTSLIIMVAVRR